MNKLTGTLWPLIAAIGLSLCSVAMAGPLQDADKAAERGDSAIAMPIWLRLANKGDMTAQLALASAYDCGGCAMYDPTEAKRWYTAAAEQGNGQAQLSLAVLYGSLSYLSYPPGPPTAKDLAESVRWLHKAAEQGVPLAEDMLGDDFVLGWGVPRDYSEAARWYRRVAAQGGAQLGNWKG